MFRSTPIVIATALVSLTLLAACGDGQEAPVEAQRVSLDEARHMPSAPLASPDTEGMGWTADGQAIHFGRAGQPPLLTLECRLRETPVRLRIVRHIAARPGEKALFPVIGNGRISRFSLDAALDEGEWRWEGELPVADPLVEVFVGAGELEATLPGGGSLLIPGNRVPGEFVTWCRAGGRLPPVETTEAPTPPSE